MHHRANYFAYTCALFGLLSCTESAASSNTASVQSLLDAQTCSDLAKRIQALGPTNRETLFPILAEFSSQSGLRAAFHFDTGTLAFVGPSNEPQGAWTLLTEVVDPQSPFAALPDNLPKGIDSEKSISFTTENGTDYIVEGVFLAGSSSGSTNFVVKEVHSETQTARFVRRYKNPSSAGLADITNAQREHWEEMGLWPKAWMEF
jgi:hypothetical protein